MKKNLAIIRWSIGFIVVGLIISGITALPLRFEVERLCEWLGVDADGGAVGLLGWLQQVREGLRVVDRQFPFLNYGTDWLAFAHFILAILFLGGARDPVRNIWLFQFGIMASAGVILWAIIVGGMRGIPWAWRAIDCSFGAIALIPMILAYRAAAKLAQENPVPRSGEM